MWDLSESPPQQTRTGDLGHPVGLEASGRGLIATAWQSTPGPGRGEDCRVERRTWENLEVIGQFALEPVTVWLQSMALSSDGRFIALAGFEEGLHLLDLRGQKVSEWEGGEWISGVAFDSSAQWLAAAHTFQGGGYVSLYQRSGEVFKTMLDELEREFDSPTPDFADTFASLAFAPDASALAVYETSWSQAEEHVKAWRGDVVVYDLPSGGLRFAQQIGAAHTGDPRSLEAMECSMGFLTDILFSPDGKEVLFGGSKGGAIALSARDGSPRRRFPLGGEEPVHMLKYEASRRMLWTLLPDAGLRGVSIDEDNTVPLSI
jgi:WD40 repeat protein